MESSGDRRTLGWREWVALPDLGIGRIKAKVDTGARTSTLHAFEVQAFQRGNDPWVRFRVHPLQHDLVTEVCCVSPILDRRVVRDSGGHEEQRFVIETRVRVAGESWPIEVTLTDRDSMGFRMLIGRTAIRGRYLVDPARSYRAGRQRKS